MYISARKLHKLGIYTIYVLILRAVAYLSDCASRSPRRLRLTGSLTQWQVRFFRMYVVYLQVGSASKQE